MMREISSTEKPEQLELSRESMNYKEIKPQEAITTEECDAFWNDVFKEGDSTDNPEVDLERVVKKYFDDLRKKSECPETIPESPFEAKDLKLRSPEENAQMREAFDDNKDDLRKQWEEMHGRPWPRYDQDMYSQNGALIRKAGSRYDAHHIHPLSMGGKNEVKNITPLSVDVHYDSQGIHSPISPFGKMNSLLGGH